MYGDYLLICPGKLTKIAKIIFLLDSDSLSVVN